MTIGFIVSLYIHINLYIITPLYFLYIQLHLISFYLCIIHTYINKEKINENVKEKMKFLFTYLKEKRTNPNKFLLSYLGHSLYLPPFCSSLLSSFIFIHTYIYTYTLFFISLSSKRKFAKGRHNIQDDNFTFYTYKRRKKKITIAHSFLIFLT